MIPAHTGGFVLDVDRSTVDLQMDTFDKKSFTYDKLFKMEATQSDVFDSLVDIVDSIMDGFNGTILAYGQTSAGKSHTMEGPSLWDMEAQGTIPRAVDRIFEGISKAASSIQFQVSVSYYEIYCERIRDLLNPAADNLKLRETKTDGFVVQDVTETYCTNRDEVLRLIELGKTYRQTAPTLMNAESSRSHSILSILLDQKDQHSGRQRRGRLFLVDLAGSEKVSKTGASGMRLEEAKNINSSLTTLGMVITALTSESATHVPYRDSKLTRLLMEALGGNSRTTLVICCAPELRHMSETVSTLRFGERAKRIQNRAKVNEELSMDELKQLLLAARREITQLKGEQEDRNATGDLSPKSSMGSLVGLLDESCVQDKDAVPCDVGHHKDNDKCLVMDRSLASSREESDRLKLALEEANNELLSLRARYATLEEELEVERAGAAAEKDCEQQLNAEILALRNTILDLESKLLRLTLEAKHMSPSLRSPSKDISDSIATPTDVQFAQLNLEASILHSHEVQDTSGTVEAQSYAIPDSSPRSDSSNSNANTYLHQYTNNELSSELKDLLEDEIKSLEANLASKDSEARSAQASAVNYAEKYIRLRDDYESHVQRLMMKLSREQQARIQAEDSLEDALQRLWNDEEERKNSTSFFSLFSSSSSSRRDERRAGLSARERSLARSLDIAQSRAFQLAAELESNKEAHSIVLDTKESVMRSLVKQNSQLTTERDTLKMRSNELTVINENLTSLLRSSATRKTQIGRASTSSIISGGGGLSVPT